MRTHTMVKVEGRDLTEVLENAGEKFDAYYGDANWTITKVLAEPLVEEFGSRLPAMWLAEVDAETIKDEPNA